MKHKYLGPITWIIKLYWKSSKLSILWIGLKTIYDGIIHIFLAYSLAQFIASVSAVAFQKGSAGDVYFWITITLIAVLINDVLQPVNGLIRQRLDNKIELASTEHFIKKMYDLSQEQFENQEFNTKIDRAREGFSRLSYVINSISETTSSIIGLVGSIGAVFIVSPIMAIVILLSIIPSIIINKRSNDRMEIHFRKNSPFNRTGYRIRWILTDPLYMPEIRLMQAFKDLIYHWKVNFKKAREAQFNANKREVKSAILANFINRFVNAGSSLYLFNLVIGGVIGFDKFIFLRSMFEQASSNITGLTYNFNTIYEDKIALENYSEIYNAKPAIKNGEVQVTKPLTIEFKNVSFSYPNSDKLVLDKVSFSIKPGEKIALVGENGAGKTTIVKLMLRQYLPTTGTIYINGYDIKDIDKDTYYQAISNLNQEFYTIDSLTIKDNLVLGLNRNITEEQIFKITDLVDATKFLKNLPHGLNSRLDPSFDNGTNLSGGQKQRLGIARTLIRNGDIMILDEPTSAIDAKAEYLIFNNIFEYHKNRTTLIISHRFSTVRKANTILVMKNGKIIENGTHEELIKVAGLYKEMFDKQAEGYK